MKRNYFAVVLLSLLWALSAAAAELVYLNTPQGEERLLKAQPRRQFFAVQPYLESQQNLAFCGPASIAAVLNSLDIPRPTAGPLYPYRYFTQDNIFTPATQGIKSYAMVSTRGMTLDEVVAFLNVLGLKAAAYRADTVDLEQLRGQLKAALAHDNQRVIVNYDRRVLDQIGAGHLSPLAAYDETSDSVLLLDVAKFKYPPTWIKLADLLEAMRSVDSDSGRSRGLVIVEKPAVN